MMRLKIKWRKVDFMFDCHLWFLSAGPEMLSAIIEQHVNLAANESEKGKLSTQFLFIFALLKEKGSSPIQPKGS